MSPAEEVTQVGNRWLVWQQYDSRSKTDLFSTAARTEAGWVVVDPIPVAPEALASGIVSMPVVAVVVTNANHERGTTDFAAAHSAPVFCDAAARAALDLPSATVVADGDRIATEIGVVRIDGAVAGEIALAFTGDGGALVIGDALINFPPYGFTLLPSKYCDDAKLLRRSLRKLLDHDFERMFFAHGLPLMSNAKARLEALVAS